MLDFYEKKVGCKWIVDCVKFYAYPKSIGNVSLLNLFHLYGHLVAAIGYLFMERRSKSTASIVTHKGISAVE